MSEYIGISDDRMKHMLSVARQCYKISLEKYKLSEDEARKMFVIGFNHDIGYEFSKKNTEHPAVGFELIANAFNTDCYTIKEHGNSDIEQSIYLKILNEADMTVDSKGNIVSASERLEDIKSRYSESAEEYINPYRICKALDLI